MMDIEDSLAAAKVSLKIEAAHSGVVNGNFLFYTPKALRAGSNSLKSFYKPLQKKHYDKTVGYIYDSSYEETNVNTTHYASISKATNPSDLVDAVKKYIKSTEYSKTPKGFGVLVANAKLYDTDKIGKLKNKDAGTVSIAGGSPQAYCSICSSTIVDCGHRLGSRYDNEVCIGIVSDDLVLDHISFETIPANWETNSLIIADSQVMGKLELLTEEGQPMKLTLVELREKLSGNLESLLAELELGEYTEQYKTDCEASLKSMFLLPQDELLPTNTPLTIYVAAKLLESIEDSEDKEILLKDLGTKYTDLFEGKSAEEVGAILASKEVVDPIASVVIEPEPVVPEATQETQLAITDADQLALNIVDSLTTMIDSKFENIVAQLSEVFTKENTVKANQILQDKIEAFKTDLVSANSFSKQLTEELRQSILNQILLLKTVDKDSEYFAGLKNRSIQELKLTLEDHLELFKTATPVAIKPVEEVALQVTDANQNVIIEPVSKEDASSVMIDDTSEDLQITDADKLVVDIVEKVGSKLTKNEYTKLYKSTVFEHGSAVAKKLHTALKSQNKI